MLGIVDNYDYVTSYSNYDTSQDEETYLHCGENTAERWIDVGEKSKKYHCCYILGS